MRMNPKEMDDGVDIVDKNVFEIISISNNLVLAWWFQDHNLVFCLFFTIRKMFFLAKIWFVKN